MYHIFWYQLHSYWLKASLNEPCPVLFWPEEVVGEMEVLKVSLPSLIPDEIFSEIQKLCGISSPTALEEKPPARQKATPRALQDWKVIPDPVQACERDCKVELLIEAKA